MKLTALLGILAGAAVMTGCGPVLSIHPLYTQEDLVSDIPLEGTWAEQDDNQVWQIHKSGDGYEAINAATAERFSVHLLRLKGVRFLDITSRSEGLAIPGHLFAKVWMEDGALRIAMMKDDWLKQMAQDGLGPQSVMDPDKDVILTAPTRELQDFVMLHADDTNAFDEPGELKTAN
jgi:hypothetical protein